MKTICYFAGGYPTMEQSLAMAEVYLKGGCTAFEWSIPPENPYIDPPHIAQRMRVSLEACGDYEVYLSQIADVKKRHPEVLIILLLYEETVRKLTPKRLLQFRDETGIDTVLSGDLADKDLIDELLKGGMKIAASIDYKMKPEDVVRVMQSNSFVYMQAMPGPDDIANGRGREMLPQCIEKLRSLGISRPIYCGVGIRSPEDVRFIRESGGNGFFLGSALLSFYDQPQKLKEMIALYDKAGK